MKKYILFIPIFLFCLATLARDKPYYFMRYAVEDGLSSNTVFCSLQDHRGFLWFGTIDGLNRFDGNTFKVFRPGRDTRGSIGNSNIISLCQDSEGSLWVGSEDGLYYFDEKSETFRLIRSTLKRGITNLQADKQGNVWFMSESQICRYVPATGRLTVFDTTEGMKASSLCVSADGALWVGTSGGLIHKLGIANGTFHSYDVFSHSTHTRSRNVPELHDTGKDFLLVGTSNQGAKLFNKKTGTYEDLLSHNESNSEIYVRDFVHYAGDEYWIATELGIFIYNLKTRSYTNLVKDNNNPYSLADNAVYTLCKDKEGGIWTGSFFGGLCYYPRQYHLFEKFFPSGTPGSLSGSAVREICRDKYGSIWVGTEDASLNKLRPGTGKFTSFTPSPERTAISYANIQGLLPVDNELWVGTFEHGMDVMDIRTNKVIRHYQYKHGPNSLKSNFVSTLYRTNAGKIYVGSAAGLYVYNAGDDNFSMIILQDGYLPFVCSILEDRRGNIWAGTIRDGVYRINKKDNSIQRFTYDSQQHNSLNSSRVNGIFESSDGTIWLSTEGGGLCRFNPSDNTFKSYTVRDGFPSNFIFRVLEDSSRNLWISTSKGLVRFQPQSEKVKIYTRDDGLLSDQFNYNSAFKDTVTGEMYFGSVKGLIRFNPDEFSENNYVAPVYLTGFEVYNEELKIGEGKSPLKKAILFTDAITLPHNQASFNIQFAALSYTAPGKTEYAYKLEGLDSEWTILKTNRQAYYTQLPPGEYTFLVKAAGSNGIWSSEATKMVIRILPPWWKSPLAWALYTLVAIMGVWLIINTYDNRIKERSRRKLELLAHKKEKEIYEAKINFFTIVAHEIRTPLTLIKGPMEKILNRADEYAFLKKNLLIMEKNTDRLLLLSEQLLDFRKAETNSFSLSFTETDIIGLLKDLYQRFQPAIDQREIHFEFDMPLNSFIAAIDVEAFNKVMSNLFSNAVKYCNKRIIVSLSDIDEEANHFSVKIKSDGYIIPYELRNKIFETFFRVKETQRQSGTGLGLSLSRSLAELMRGTLVLAEPEDDMNVFVLNLQIKL